MARMSKEDKLKKEVSEYKKKHGIPEKNEEDEKEEITVAEKEPSFWHQMIPFFLVIGALLIVACFVFTEQTGWFGAAISGLFYGLFSFVSWVIPMLLVFLAIFWRKESFKSTMKSKFIVMGIIAVILSCGAFYMSVMVNGGETPSMTPSNIWNSAQRENGFKYGGIVGSYLGWIVFKVFSKVGTPIVLLSILTVMCIFLFDVKPDTAWMFFKRVCKFTWRGICKIVKKLYYKIKGTKTTNKKIYINKPGRTQQSEADATPEAVKNTSVPKAQAKKEMKPVMLDDDVLDGLEDQSECEATEEVSATEPTPKLKKKGEVKGGALDLDKIFIEEDTSQNAEPVVSEAKEDDVSVVGYKSNEGSAAKIYGEEDEERHLEEPENLTIQRAPLITTIEAGDAIPEEEMSYTFPPIEFLQPKEEGISDEEYEEECKVTGRKLVEVLKSFKVETRLVNISRGPTITRYELAPEEGVRVKTIAGLSDDIALNLAAKGAVRIEAPIVGKAAVGVEIANAKRETVYLRELLENPTFKNAKSRLTTALGLDVAGDPIYMDIAKMPHLLIAGTTGAGKSVCINCLVLSLLYNATPDEVKLIMIDPKKVEFNIYNGLPHLIVPVVSNPKKSAGALIWAVDEMERRYDLIEKVGVRDIAGYNEITRDDPEMEYLPKLVIVIDELADLMMTSPDSVETSICRIAQKGRACGMHLVIGTQRPSVDVITGLIKANVPSRIAFTVSSQVDSRTIIDVGGAEKLIGRGDMLYAPTGAMKPIRLQGAFVSDSEVDKITEFIRANNKKTEYSDEIMTDIENKAERCAAKGAKKSSFNESPVEGGEDEGNIALTDVKFVDAVNLAIEEGKISTSLLQRKLNLGYGRAAKIIDAMEALGISSAPDGQKARRILISREEWEEMYMKWNTDSDY